MYLLIVSGDSFLNHHFLLFVFHKFLYFMFMPIALWTARRYTAPLHFRRPGSRLVDLSRSCPPLSLPFRFLYSLHCSIKLKTKMPEIKSNAISRPICTYFTRWLIHTNSYDLTQSRTIVYTPVMGRFRGGVRSRSFVQIHTNCATRKICTI